MISSEHILRFIVENQKEFIFKYEVSREERKKEKIYTLPSIEIMIFFIIIIFVILKAGKREAKFNFLKVIIACMKKVIE